MFLSDHIARFWTLRRRTGVELSVYLYILYRENGKTHSRYLAKKMVRSHLSTCQILRKLERIGFVRVTPSGNGLTVTAVSQKEVPIVFPALGRYELPEWLLNSPTALKTFTYAVSVLSLQEARRRALKRQPHQRDAADVVAQAYYARQLKVTQVALTLQMQKAEKLGLISREWRHEVVGFVKRRRMALSACADARKLDAGVPIFPRKTEGGWQIVENKGMGFSTNLRVRKSRHLTRDQMRFVRMMREKAKHGRLSAESKAFLFALLEEEQTLYLDAKGIGRLLRG